jgi:hypothetical protein
MTYVTWKLEHNSWNGTGWSGTTTTLTDCFDILVEASIGEGKDSFQFKIENFNNTYDNFFKTQDKITIYRVANTSTIGAGDVIMVGSINSAQNESSGTSNIIRVSGYNWSESIMSSLTFVDINGLTPPQAIEAAINNARTTNTNITVTWDNTNPSTKNGGGSFPLIYKRYYNVPLNKMIEEVSSNVYTDDGVYIWWVGNDNKLKWKHVDYGNTDTFNASTDERLSIKDTIDTKDVRNYIILKGGSDPAGKPIQSKQINFPSVSRFGNKYYIATGQTTTAQNLNAMDIPDTNATDRFPTTYPFDTAWKKKSTGLPVTVNSDSEYVAAIRAEAQDLLDAEAKRIAETLGKGKLKVDITFVAGTKPWLITDRITVTLPRLFSSFKVLRVAEAQYGTTQDTFSLEEDIGTVI